MLVEGVHFDLAYTPLKHLGYKAVISNLSDIFAMNCDCTQITVSIEGYQIDLLWNQLRNFIWELGLHVKNLKSI